MRPRLPDKVTVRNPGTPTVSEDTGNQVPGEPVEYVTQAYISQRPVENLSSAIELTGLQATAISLWSILVPSAIPLRPDSKVIDARGQVFEVEGNPATRFGMLGARRPIYKAAAMRLVSDMQGV
jgi:hypothetical protein